ncbi:hypothetical protein [Roseibium aggregatum]|uniref:Uncharacterized protein n=1 Tax=Roseibium aggregatum TaxID=187304 RepID=A0A0M6Y1J7_9HYPH|nr:hypothetical protein [Roseibium aggregatum]CTQ42699.1 hypothetical protein LAL4801_01135 [Roseibium aggregatum]
MANEITTRDNLPAVSDNGLLTGTLDRASEIRHVMATDRDRYRREGLDQELAGLIQAETYGDSAPLTPLPATQSQALFKSTAEGAELAAAWRGAPGGFEGQLALAQKAASQILAGVGDQTAQKAFTERFSRSLTERARYHVYNELRNGAAANVQPVSSGDVQIFRNTQAGAELVEEWGVHAPFRVARVWERFDRLKRALADDDDFDSFVDWYAALKPEMVKTICRYLSA